MAPRRIRQNESGFVFLGALMVMIVLGLSCMLLVKTTTEEQMSAANFSRSLRARTAAESGVDAVLSQLPPAAPLPAEPVKAGGALGSAQFHAQSARFDPTRYSLLPGAAGLSAGTILEIVSTGTVQGTKNSKVEQRVTAIVDNGPAKPRVLLWFVETPVE